MQGALSRTAVSLVAVALVSPAAAGQQRQSETREQAPVIVEVRDDGFDWGAAGIGAVGGFGLALFASSVLNRWRQPSSATDPQLERDTHADIPPAGDRSRASGAVPKKGDSR
jgi:hypothetical protein